MKANKKDLVGNTAGRRENVQAAHRRVAGQTARAAGRRAAARHAPGPVPKKICFVGRRTSRRGTGTTFKDQIVEIIDTKINTSQAFAQIIRRFTEAGLREARMRPDELFLPANQRKFLAIIESQGRPVFITSCSPPSPRHDPTADATQKDYPADAGNWSTSRPARRIRSRPRSARATARAGFRNDVSRGFVPGVETPAILGDPFGVQKTLRFFVC